MPIIGVTKRVGKEVHSIVIDEESGTASRSIFLCGKPTRIIDRQCGSRVEIECEFSRIYNDSLGALMFEQGIPAKELVNKDQESGWIRGWFTSRLTR